MDRRFFIRNICFGVIFLAWSNRFKKCIVSSRVCAGYAIFLNFLKFSKMKKNSNETVFIHNFAINLNYHV